MAERRATTRTPALRRPAGRRATFHHGDLRRALVEAAVALIAEGAGDSFTLREVARRVGVNHRAMYHHFADKRALLVEVAVEGWRGLLDAMRDELAGQPGDAPMRDRVLAVGRAYVGYAIAQPAHYRVMLGARLNVDLRFPELEAVLDEATALVSAEVARGIARGELPAREPHQAALTLWAAVHGIADLLLERRIKVRPTLLPAYVEQLLRPTVLGLELP